MKQILGSFCLFHFMPESVRQKEEVKMKAYGESQRTWRRHSESLDTVLGTLEASKCEDDKFPK